MDILYNVLAKYGFDRAHCTIENFGSGLINSTCLVKKNLEKFILQKVNHHVFKKPFLIADNLDKIQLHLSKSTNEYYFTAPLKTIDGESMVYVEGEGYFRVFPFVPDSHTIDVVASPMQAFEAARQFSAFTKALSGIDINSLNITLTDFHNLSLRYEQFNNAIKNGNPERIQECAEIIEAFKGFEEIVNVYEAIKTNPEFKLRVTHHDTKISNVLFDKNDKGICVIDLDTVMPGYFISDVGDMMRTYLSPISEEESDFSKIEIREDFYRAIVNGYNTYMKDELTDFEQQHFFYSGKFMIYMQGLRFITDYLNNDVYYGAKYPKHNLVRGANQLSLLKKLIEKEAVLSDN